MKKLIFAFILAPILLVGLVGLVGLAERNSSTNLSKQPNQVSLTQSRSKTQPTLLAWITTWTQATAQVETITQTQTTAQAQTELEEQPIVQELESVLEATDSAQATDPAQTASPAAQVEQKIKEKQAEDITETGGEQKGKLAAFLENNPIGTLSWHNFLQHAIRNAVDKGLPANIIVLLLLFPLTASIIAASRHIIGLRGFGIYIPAVLAVAFVSMGLITGIIIFFAVLIGAMITRRLVQLLRFPYLPRTAMILWGVSLFILLLLIFSSQLALFEILTISIFPILIIIVLSENFMESQLFSSQSEAFKITLETLFIAIVCSWIINLDSVQQAVLLMPEITLLGTALVNYLIGRYTGLRLIEYLRFKSILTQERKYTFHGDDQSE
ncbi:MAG: hypothetical protein GF381_03480 [Candidatus Pacebacteria bacterium]|nr:hypothetical protein [Candidatus Paceibacterota bacterium]